MKVVCYLLLGALVFGVNSASNKAETRKWEKEDCSQGVNCHLPDCLCASTQHPTNLPLSEVPQFVILSFDDAVTPQSFDFYTSLENFTNPNDCRITLTLYISHLYTDYCKVAKLNSMGHEIALHSVTHKTDTWSYWRVANQSVWEHEMQDMKTMLKEYVALSDEDYNKIKGWRSPFLYMGGNIMFEALRASGLEYDSSWPTSQYTNWNDNGKDALWPYTLDFPSPQECNVGTCPTDLFPGTWIVPMLSLLDNKGYSCSMLDGCQSLENELLDDPDAVEYFLKRNFEYNYLGNKAPFGLYAHYSWFVQGEISGSDARHVGYKRFLKWLSELPDVYVASVDRVVEWMKDPVSINEMPTTDTFSCPAVDPTNPCTECTTHVFSQDQNLPNGQYEVVMAACTPDSPPYFPWLYNPLGELDMEPV